MLIAILHALAEAKIRFWKILVMHLDIRVGLFYIFVYTDTGTTASSSATSMVKEKVRSSWIMSTAVD